MLRKTLRFALFSFETYGGRKYQNKSLPTNTKLQVAI